jgi:mannose-6-phosphate isomerase-like protein (cupin superfamily)
MKFTKNDSLKIDWDGVNAWVYSSNEDLEAGSAIYFEIKTHHGKCMSKKSDRIYYIVDGQGEYEIDGKTFSVKKEDVIIVPKNTPYDYKATNDTILKVFLVHTPAFDPDAEVKFDNY